jgi:hypothetical protein
MKPLNLRAGLLCKKHEINSAIHHRNVRAQHDQKHVDVCATDAAVTSPLMSLQRQLHRILRHTNQRKIQAIQLPVRSNSGNINYEK